MRGSAKLEESEGLSSCGHDGDVRCRASLGCVSSNMPVELDSTERALAVFKFLFF